MLQKHKIFLKMINGESHTLEVLGTSDTAIMERILNDLRHNNFVKIGDLIISSSEICYAYMLERTY